MELSTCIKSDSINRPLLQILKNETLITQSCRIHYKITRDTSQKSLVFHSKAWQKQYNEKNKKTKMVCSTLSFERHSQVELPIFLETCIFL